MGQRKLYKTKLQRGLHLCDFSSFMLQSYLQIHIYIHLLIPRLKESTEQEMMLFKILFPSQRYSLMHFVFPCHSWGEKGACWWREWAQSRYHIAGRPGTRAADSTCFLAIRHTGWVHYIFLKYHMLNASQHCLITVSENTAMSNFYVFLFVTPNLQLFSSHFSGFTFMDV